MPSTDIPGDIDRLASRFLDHSLSHAEWTHAAHFAVALWMLRAGRAAELPARIRAYNEAVGTPNTATSGYHETITRASLLVARLALEKSGNAALSEVLTGLLASPCGRSDWLFAHWTRARLFTPQARRRWVAPDLAPLPVA